MPSHVASHKLSGFLRHPWLWRGGLIAAVLAGAWWMHSRNGTQVFDFGTAAYGDFIEKDLTLDNPRAEALKVLNVRIDCDCTQVATPNPVIPAGSATTARVSLSAIYPGPSRITIEVDLGSQTSGSQEVVQTRRFILRGTILEPQLPESWTAAPSNRTDDSLWIAPQQAIAFHAAAQTTFLDLRGLSAFQATHIAGSLPLPSYGIDNLPAPPDRDAILVSPLEVEPLAIAAAQKANRAAGRMRVRLLDGGLQGWVRSLGPTEGTVPQQECLLESVPFHLMPRIVNSPEWIIWNASNAPALRKLLPANRIYSGSNFPKSADTSSRRAKILWIGKPEALRTMCQQHRSVPDADLFILQGALPAFYQQLAQTLHPGQPSAFAQLASSHPTSPHPFWGSTSHGSGGGCGGCTK